MNMHVSIEYYPSVYFCYSDARKQHVVVLICISWSIPNEGEPFLMSSLARCVHSLKVVFVSCDHFPINT